MKSNYTKIYQNKLAALMKEYSTKIERQDLIGQTVNVALLVNDALINAEIAHNVKRFDMANMHAEPRDFE